MKKLRNSKDDPNVKAQWIAVDEEKGQTMTDEIVNQFHVWEKYVQLHSTAGDEENDSPNYIYVVKGEASDLRTYVFLNTQSPHTLGLLGNHTAFNQCVYTALQKLHPTFYDMRTGNEEPQPMEVEEDPDAF